MAHAVEKGMVSPKGSWQSPWQIHKAALYKKARFEREDIDLEEFYQRKKINYFGRVTSIIDKSDYDRLFQDDDQREPRVKLKDIRNNIFNEEANRIFPVVTSHTYGHRDTNLEGKTWGMHKKIDVMSEIYRRYYTNLKPTKKSPGSLKVEQL